jgi:hypothetical protein
MLAFAAVLCLIVVALLRPSQDSERTARRARGASSKEQA